MQGFEWAENNLGVESPDQLQGQGVNVYFAPNIRPNAKVVNLASGAVNWFQAEEDRPDAGCYADYETLERYCRQRGLPLTEVNGLASVQPVGFEQAGDPLRHHGR